MVSVAQGGIHEADTNRGERPDDLRFGGLVQHCGFHAASM